MKRSEMIERLNALMQLHLDEKYAKTSTKRLAEIVLDLCEQAGMMPPIIKGYQMEDIGTGEILEAVDSTNEWEPEDEKK